LRENISKYRSVRMMDSDVTKIVSIMKASCLHAYLATVDGDEPRVRPVTAMVEDDMSIWVATFSNSRKVKQLGKNPNVCLAFVEHPGGDKAAVVLGRAVPETSPEQRRRVWKLSPSDLTAYFPDGPDSQAYCLLRIAPRQIEWREDWESGNKTFVPGP
jgi:general stress protein 26